MGVDNINIIKKIILDKEITACVQCLNHGIQVTVAGCDLSHVGSVSIDYDYKYKKEGGFL
jgi:hypothetical protein